MKSLKGNSYLKRLKEVNAIYDYWAEKGVSNANIWRMYIYPVYGIAERTFYYHLKNAGRLDEIPDMPDPNQLMLFDDAST